MSDSVTHGYNATPEIASVEDANYIHPPHDILAVIAGVFDATRRTTALRLISSIDAHHRRAYAIRPYRRRIVPRMINNINYLSVILFYANFVSDKWHG